ncbi:hypothetical protein D3C81_2339930 [compost metagenome]
MQYTDCLGDVLVNGRVTETNLADAVDRRMDVREGPLDVFFQRVIERDGGG